jgi:hypothetical protein
MTVVVSTFGSQSFQTSSDGCRKDEQIVACDRPASIITISICIREHVYVTESFVTRGVCNLD